VAPGTKRYGGCCWSAKSDSSCSTTIHWELIKFNLCVHGGDLPRKLPFFSVVYFRSWHSEVFSATTSLIGTITDMSSLRGRGKIFSEKGFEMSSVPDRKLEKRSVRKSKHTGGARVTRVALRFTIHPEEKRELV